MQVLYFIYILQWRHDERDGVSTHQSHGCFLNRLIRRRKHQSSASLAFVDGNSPVTGEFPAHRASNAEMVPFDDVIMILISGKNPDPLWWKRQACGAVSYRQTTTRSWLTRIQDSERWACVLHEPTRGVAQGAL